MSMAALFSEHSQLKREHKTEMRQSLRIVTGLQIYIPIHEIRQGHQVVGLFKVTYYYVAGQSLCSYQC